MTVPWCFASLSWFVNFFHFFKGLERDRPGLLTGLKQERNEIMRKQAEERVANRQKQMTKLDWKQMSANGAADTEGGQEADGGPRGFSFGFSFQEPGEN